MQQCIMVQKHYNLLALEIDKIKKRFLLNLIIFINRLYDGPYLFQALIQLEHL